MKNIILMALITLVSGTVFANGDQYEVVYNCTRMEGHADAGLNVQLLKGGFAGKPTIRVTRMILNKRQVDNYFVEQQKAPAGRMGAPNVYTGQGIKFTINMTTAPLEGGKRAASMELEGKDKESLKCEMK